MGRLDQRQGFLVSAIVHLAILMALASRPAPPREVATPSPPPSPAPPRIALIAPDPEVLRDLARPRPAVPTPPPPPPPEGTKDRMSVGAPSDARQERLVLKRDEDLAVPKGTPRGGLSEPAPGPAPPPPSQTAEATASLPPAPGGQRIPASPGPERPSIASSLRSLERRLQDAGPRGLPTGTGRQMGPLFFDPEGADFTAWLNHFKNEVYRNWIVPQPALLGFRGHVDIEFVVERDGTISSLRIVKSTGTPALDRAAQNALLGSRLRPLPADFGPPRVTMQGGFYYNAGPQGS